MMIPINQCITSLAKGFGVAQTELPMLKIEA